MKNIRKFALVGTMLAVAGSVAFASPVSTGVTFSGAITVQDAPAGDIGSFDSTVFTISSLTTGTSSLGVAEPNVPAGSTNLSSFITNPTLFTFSTSSITTGGPTGVEIYTGSNTAGTQSASFFGTSYSSLLQDLNGDYGLTVYGYFTDNIGTHTPGYDNITFNSGIINSTADTTNGSVSEILTATPTAPTPEPSSLLLLGSGLLGGAGMVFRKYRAIV